MLICDFPQYYICIYFIYLYHIILKLYIYIYIYIRIYIYIIYIYLLVLWKVYMLWYVGEAYTFSCWSKRLGEGGWRGEQCNNECCCTCTVQKGWSRTVAGASTTAQPSFWPEAQKQNSPDIVVNLLASVYCTDCTSSANLKLKFLCAKSVLHRSRFPEGFLRMCSDHTTQWSGISFAFPWIRTCTFWWRDRKAPLHKAMLRALATRFLISTGFLALKRTGSPRRVPVMVKYCTVMTLCRAIILQVTTKRSSGVVLSTIMAGVQDGPGRGRAQTFAPSSGTGSHRGSSPGSSKCFIKPTSKMNSSRTGITRAWSHAVAGRLKITPAKCCSCSGTSISCQGRIAVS